MNVIKQETIGDTEITFFKEELFSGAIYCGIEVVLYDENGSHTLEARKGATMGVYNQLVEHFKNKLK